MIKKHSNGSNFITGGGWAGAVGPAPRSLLSSADEAVAAFRQFCRRKSHQANKPNSPATRVASRPLLSQLDVRSCRRKEAALTLDPLYLLVLQRDLAVNSFVVIVNARVTTCLREGFFGELCVFQTAWKEGGGLCACVSALWVPKQQAPVFRGNEATHMTAGLVEPRLASFWEGHLVLPRTSRDGRDGFGVDG